MRGAARGAVFGAFGIKGLGVGVYVALGNWLKGWVAY